MNGYTGKLLNFNLNDGSAKEFAVPEEIYEKFIGGRGVGAWLLLNGLDPHVDPLEPNNALVMLTGPLTGLSIPSVNNLCICTRSPLTGTIVCASLSGDFAEKLKSCGYDGLIFRGKSPRPVLLDITEGQWKLRDAENIWGTNVARTQELLESRKASTLCIGPAGENLVRFATIVSGEHTAQRGGTGAVMGSKLLKAVRAGGTFKTAVFDSERLKQPVETIKERLKTPDCFPRYGTASNVTRSNEKGILPTRNFSFGTYDHYLKITGESLRSQIRRKGFDCSGCPVNCTSEMKLATHSDVIRVKGPGYQPLVMLGSNLMIDDLDTIIRNNYLCYLLGMDPISTGGTIAAAIELSERGRMELPLRFGRDEDIGPLLPLIAEARGPGAELSEGAMRLVSKYGYSEYAMTVKGLEMSGYDPRGSWGQGLAYATCPYGGSHIGSMMVAPESQGKPVEINPTSAGGKSEATAFSQNMFSALDCLVACHRACYCVSTVPGFTTRLPQWVINFVTSNFPRISHNFVNMSEYYSALSYITGVRFNRSTFLLAGERVFNMERLFNLREGFTSKDDILPLRFIGEPFREGPSAGNVVPLTKLLLKYYKIRGWNEVGIPTQKRLKKLGISEHAGY
ncbi:MAG: aldehyde ferredoxin oxidoreductase family protein [Actinobacteria bacterium]|nr:aldehyde ferredoxin oxidoreductase family protein [Actinomycetota bacterium]